MSLLKKRTYYRPFEFPWMYEMYKKHRSMDWVPEDVELGDDIFDWNHKLTSEERNLLTQLFRFFTQADVDVSKGYYHVYIPALGNSPEACMMMGNFADRESLHMDAYSLLIDTIGMPETTYKAFLDYEVMEAKHDFLEEFSADNSYELLKSLAVYSAFTEGMQLFSSFAILMNFERFGKMKGMCNIVRWSIRDESMHVEGMTKLFRELHGEVPLESSDVYPYGVTDKLTEEIFIVAHKMVSLEDHFIDLCFEMGEPEGLSKEDLKGYIRYIANARWNQLGFSGYLYGDHKDNPLEWLDWVIFGQEHTNFFEGKPTEYSQGSLIDAGNINW